MIGKIKVVGEDEPLHQVVRSDGYATIEGYTSIRNADVAESDVSSERGASLATGMAYGC